MSCNGPQAGPAQAGEEKKNRRQENRRHCEFTVTPSEAHLL